MTLDEYKAWLDGYTEQMGDKPPTEEQWRRIREQLDSVERQGCPWPHWHWDWTHTYPTNPTYPIYPTNPTGTSPNTFTTKITCGDLTYASPGTRKFREASRSYTLV